jgi:hypothetical protein
MISSDFISFIKGRIKSFRQWRCHKFNKHEPELYNVGQNYGYECKWCRVHLIEKPDGFHGKS